MKFFWFDKCCINKLDEIDYWFNIAGLKEQKDEQASFRYWLGETNFSVAYYNPKLKLPLMLQTREDQKVLTPEVEGLLEKISEITGSKYHTEYIEETKVNINHFV